MLSGGCRAPDCGTPTDGGAQEQLKDARVSEGAAAAIRSGTTSTSPSTRSSSPTQALQPSVAAQRLQSAFRGFLVRREEAAELRAAESRVALLLGRELELELERDVAARRLQRWCHHRIEARLAAAIERAELVTRHMEQEQELADVEPNAAWGPRSVRWWAGGGCSLSAEEQERRASEEVLRAEAPYPWREATGTGDAALDALIAASVTG